MDSTTPNLKVHYLQVSQAERIPWLLEELSLPYTLQIYQRAPVLSPPDLVAFHPMGASPIIEDLTDPSHPLILAESGAIAEYIIHKYGNGRLALKPDHKNYADYLYFFHFANGNMQPVIMRYFTAVSMTTPTDPRAAQANERLHRDLKQINSRLEVTKAWLAGEEFTVADIMMVFSLTTMRKFMNYSLEGYDATLAWLERCMSREGYKKGMEKADPERLKEGKRLRSKEGPERFEGIAIMAKMMEEKARMDKEKE